MPWLYWAYTMHEAPPLHTVGHHGRASSKRTLTCTRSMTYVKPTGSRRTTGLLPPTLTGSIKSQQSKKRRLRLVRWRTSSLVVWSLHLMPSMVRRALDSKPRRYRTRERGNGQKLSSIRLNWKACGVRCTSSFGGRRNDDARGVSKEPSSSNSSRAPPTARRGEHNSRTR